MNPRNSYRSTRRRRHRAAALTALAVTVMLPLAGGASALAQAPPLLIATVDGDSVWSNELVAQAHRLPALDDEDPIAYRHRLLQPLLHRLLLKAEAERRGLFDDPAVLAELASDEHKELERRLLEQGDDDEDLVRMQILDEMGYQANEAAIIELAAAMDMYDTKDPAAYQLPLVPPGAIDTTLVLYRADDTTYTVADFIAGPGAQRTMYTASLVGDPRRIGYDLASTYASGAAPQVARQRGIDRAIDYRAWKAARHEELAITALYENTVVPASHPSDEEVRAYYEANLPRYTEQDKVETDSWSFSDSTMARRIERALKQGLPVNTVNALARADDSFGVRRTLQQPLDNWLRDTRLEPDPGTIACVPRVGTSWVHLVLGVVPGQLRAFETVEREVQRELEQQRAEEKLMELLDDARASVEVEIFDDALADVPI
jgi:hypothetical protein